MEYGAWRIEKKIASYHLPGEVVWERLLVATDE